LGEADQMLTQALQYAGRGWHVFPVHTVSDGRCSCGQLCESPGKHPRVKWATVATTNTEQIESWWRRWPDANIGIATGPSGLIVLDPDDAEGVAELQALAEAYGPLPKTLTSKTGRGFHIYYAGTGIKSYNSGKLHVKADGGYVLAPPSCHWSGAIYNWANQEPVRSRPEWLPTWRAGLSAPMNGHQRDGIERLGPLPSYLQRQGAEGIPRLADRAVEIVWTRWSVHEEARLRSALKAIPSTEYEIWLRVGMALHQLGWDRSDGTSIGFDIWTEWSATCDEKYSLTACEKAWSSFKRDDASVVTVGSIFYMARHNGWTDSPVLNEYSTRIPEGGDIQHLGKNSGRAAMFSAATLRTMTFEPIRFVLPGFVPEGLTLLVGRPKVGKSWWALDLCLACAGDRPTLGRTPRAGDVLYLALEDGKRRLQHRINKLTSTSNDEWPERLTLVAMGGWYRADQGGLEEIEAWCKSVPNPTLVVIDTLERIRKPASGKSPLYSADYEAITGLQRIASEFGIGIVVLHHDRKSEADDAFDTVSGTLGLTGAADTILIIKRRPNGVVLYARGRDIEESETAMQFDKDTCRWVVLGAAADVQRSNERGRIIAALKSASQPLSPKEILIEAEMRNLNATNILLHKMAGDGAIVRVVRGRYALLTASNGKIGKIGQKERLDGKDTDSIDKNGNLSNLSDLSRDATTVR
jgi:hypothetical protein